MWTSSICFLCVKTFSCCNKDDPNTDKYQLKLNTINSQSLALFSERFLKLPPESRFISHLCSNETRETVETQQSLSGTSSSSSFLHQFCSDCLEILEGTFQLYNELCEVRLKMAWRLGQWEALLKVDETSKPSSKLNSLLHQKLAEQLQLELDLGMGKNGTEEVRQMRNLLLSHCKKARNQMLDHRNLEVALDRSSVPFPVAREGKCPDFTECGTTTTSFLVLDSKPPFSNDDDADVDVVVKRELEDQEFECEDFAPMDFEAEADDFPKAELIAASSSTEPVATARLRRSTKNNDYCYFPKTKKPPAKKVKVENEKPKVKKEKIKITNSTKTNRDIEITCQLCKKVIVANIKRLRSHFQVHIERRFKSRKLPKPTFQCRFCWKSFIFEQLRSLHEEFGTHDRNMTSMKFTCYEEVCNGNPPLTSFNDLEAHFENVHQTKGGIVHKCSRCRWPFTSDDMREIHELTHEHYPVTKLNQSRPQTFKCPKCERQDFSYFSGLQTHFISEHTNIEDVRIYKCQKCSNSYSKAISLEDHLKTHEMEEDLANTEKTGAGSSTDFKYHVCEECGRRCATSKMLSRHKTHFHRRVQCTLCGEILPPTSLSWHMRFVHKVGRPLKQSQHPCPICQKIFRTKHGMQRHSRDIHGENKDDEVSEVCHICSKKYQRRGLLYRHLRVAHQIEAEELKRPGEFICPECGMGYYYKNSLDAHVEAKHRRPEERKNHFPCTLCSKTFWRKCVLTKHLEEAHSQQQVEVQGEADLNKIIDQ